MTRKLLTTTLLFIAVTAAQAGERNACRVGEPAIDHEVLALLESGAPAVDVALTARNGVARESIGETEAVLYTPYVKAVVADDSRAAAPANEQLARRPRSLHGYHVEE